MMGSTPSRCAITDGKGFSGDFPFNLLGPEESDGEPE